MEESYKQKEIQKLKEEKGILKSDLGELQKRFDRHLEIYAQNGKELAKLSNKGEANTGSNLIMTF